MKGWKKPKAFAAAYSAQKRFLAFVLTFAMLFTSVGTDLNVSYAAQGNKVDFEIYGSDLVDAINQAVADDNVVTPGSLEFTNGAIDKFETLFYGEGKVYEVYPQIDGGDMDAELRVFVRLPEDADDMYMVTGDEEVIFLYVNNGDETISCATRIIRSVDGEEKVKTTKRINVKSYEDKFGDEEVDIVSKKVETVEETTAAEEKSQETAEAASEETTAAEEKETEITEETTETPADETTEAADETTEAETKEAAAEAEEKTEAETEQEAVEETEKETSEEVAAEGEVTASVSRHYAPVVAMKEDAEAVPEKETAEAVETEKEVTEAETEEKETTEAVEKETAEAVETEQDTTEAESKDAEVAETETEAADETSETEETAEETSSEETAAESKENKATEATEETQSETSKAIETTAVAKEEETKKADAATDNDLVGIGYCSTAKAYTTTVASLKALDDIQGLKITYAINPEYSARIVDGPRGVEEGEALVFGVKNQIGYAIESVTANGEFLEADSTSENEDGSVTAWYSVPEITEEQEIEVYMTETGEHPEFNAELTMEDGTIITLHAAEGVLPAGVTAEATVVNGLEDVLKEKLENEDGTAVQEVIVYDINLMLNGKKLDNNWSQNGSVTVTFSGTKIEEFTADASAVEIYAIDGTSENPITEEKAADVSADELGLEYLNTTDVSDASADEVSFEAQHFTEIALASRSNNETYRKATFKASLENVEVAYINYHAGDSISDNDVTFTSITSGDFEITDYISSRRDAYVVFVAKADTNYLLTGMGAYGNGDIYSLDGSVNNGDYGNINSYPGLATIVEKAKDKGYVACFGYMRGKNESLNADFEIKAFQPEMQLDVRSSKSNNVIPGDELEFTVTVTPATTVGEKTITPTKVVVNKVMINGQEQEISNVQNNYDGTYTLTVKYTATDADCSSGAVTLGVSSNVTYQYNMAVSIGSVTTTSTVSSTTSATCTIAGKNTVAYLPLYAATDGEVPENKPRTLASSLPTDNTEYYVGTKINVKDFTGVPEMVDDSENSGYWVRGDQWTDKNGNLVNTENLVQGDNRTSLYVTWTFHKYVTINYIVAKGKGNVSPSSETLNPISGRVSGSTATASTGYEFVGWYEDEDCTTQVSSGVSFVPTEKKAATYYAKFAAKNDVSYTVHYYEEGTTNKVAEDSIRENKTFDTTVEENAIEVTGYDVVESNVQTVILDAYNKAITFYYRAKTISYTVKYLEKRTNKVLQDKKTGTAKFGSKVEETAADVPGYTPDENSKTIEKLNYEDNVITFYYTENDDVKIQYKVANGQESMGQVNSESELVKPVTGIPSGSTASTKDSNHFMYWTVNGKIVSKNATLTSDVVKANAKDSETGIFVETTFVANFQPLLVLKANDREKPYDGTELTGADAGYSIVEGQLKTGDVLEVTYSGSQKDAGSSSNKISNAKVYRTVDGEKVDVTKEYAFDPYQDGILTVTKAVVHMKSASEERFYNGEPLTKTDDMVINGFADDEGVECYDFASQTDVGSTPNTFRYRAADNTNLSNYDIKPENIEYGILTVKQIETPIIVTAKTASKVYDGTPLTDSYTVTDGDNLVEGDMLVVKVAGSITNVSDGENGTVANKITECKVMRGDEDVTSNYTLVTHDGALTITPRKITVTSATDQKTYDGTPLTNSAVTAEATEPETYNPFVGNEGLVYHVNGSRLDEGSSDNTFTYDAKEGTDLTNYLITKVVGKLTVTKKANVIVITANSKSRMYNGTPLTDSGYVYTTGVLADGDVLTAEVEGTITDVGTVDNKVKSYVVKRGDTDVTGNYTFGDSVSGTLEVTKRDVKITSGSSKRAYSGDPLTNSEITVTGSGFVSGQEPTYNVTGTITNVGKVDNEFTYELPAGVKADNYSIETVNGKLEITPVENKIQITAGSREKMYDGTALTDKSFTYTKGILVSGDELKAEISGTQVVKGESANTVESYKVVNAAGDDVTGNYTFDESVAGKLTVTARQITITAASDIKKYDGTALTADSYTVSENGLAERDEISAITIDGSQIEIGTSSNAVRAGSVKITKTVEAADARSAAEDVTDNYDITLVPGVLEVTNRNDLSYIVNYHYLDAKGSEVAAESETTNNAFIGEEILYSDAVRRDYDGKTYAFVCVDGAGKTVEYYAKDAENPNVVDVYYGLDEIGTNPDSPVTPDGIPDMYQVVFKYTSENPSYGTVNGAAVVDGYVMEVVTRPTKADGSYDMDAEVHPSGKVTVTGIGSYVFNHWSDDDTNYADANEIAGKGFTTDTIFVAHFSYNGGNNNNGGNNGGNSSHGGSSGGGSSSSGSGSIKITSGGPGAQTVTIDAEDVPLAELPDAPASPVEIDDGEVPLAALPKTGQTTMKLTITLMFSGIFLALTAMNKRHKEEEN